MYDNATYDISKLDGWVGRPSDLNRVNFWRNLLKDFGAALLPFLIDEEYIGLIPEDRRLDKFKKDSKERPSRLFKTYPDAVWVLMAYGDRYAKLPDPFSRDGFLFPLEWRKVESGRDGKHSELLPEALLELADKVKRQFADNGIAAEDFYLHPWHGFRDTVDFSNINIGTKRVDGTDSDFDSAWGALATGLFSIAAGTQKSGAARWTERVSKLFSRRTASDGMLANWPFSSIAFDFKNNQPTHVSHLEKKIAIVARYGGNEIAVAPNQQKELKAELDKFNVKHGVKIRCFDWKWRKGDFRDGIRTLAQCNQPHVQRSIVILALTGGCVILCLAAAKQTKRVQWTKSELDFTRQKVERIEEFANLLERKEIRPYEDFLFDHSNDTNDLGCFLADFRKKHKYQKGNLAGPCVTKFMLLAMAKDIWRIRGGKLTHDETNLLLRAVDIWTNRPYTIESKSFPKGCAELFKAQLECSNGRSNAAAKVLSCIPCDAPCFSAAQWLRINCMEDADYRMRLVLCEKAYQEAKHTAQMWLLRGCPMEIRNTEILWLLRKINIAIRSDEKKDLVTFFTELLRAIKAKKKIAELSLGELYKPANVSLIKKYLTEYESKRGRSDLFPEDVMASFVATLQAIELLPLCDAMYVQGVMTQTNGWQEEFDDLVSTEDAFSRLLTVYFAVNRVKILSSIVFHKRMSMWLRSCGDVSGADHVKKLVDLVEDTIGRYDVR